MIKKQKFRILIISILVIIGICGCGNDTVEYVSSEENTGSEGVTEGEVSIEGETNTGETSVEEPRQIYVYVCGAVAAPGVYAMQEGNRVCDLFQMAGGLTPDAAGDYWNQARLLVDGEMIYVPTQEEAEERTTEEWVTAGGSKVTEDTDNQENKKVNINTASMEELMTLPGIGESKALAIMAYRKEHGGFSSIEELKEISGIKDGVFSKIEDYIVID